MLFKYSLYQIFFNNVPIKFFLTVTFYLQSSTWIEIKNVQLAIKANVTYIFILQISLP